MDKDKAIKQEINKYKKIFAKIDEEKQPFAERLYKQAAFMEVTLQELQDRVKENGAIVEGMNGNGFVVCSENPAQKSYNIMIKNYNATIKALVDMLPKEEKESDELLNFISGNA